MDQTEAAYDALACVYDALTADHDYEAWTAEILALARRHGLGGRRLLDLACGTGKSFLPFLGRGFTVTGCDVSSAMLGRARHKAGDHARLVRADVRQLPPLGEFDLVTCLDDAVNYLRDYGELEAAFAGAARCLAPGGIFVFDVNTLGVYRSLFARDTCSEADSCLFVIRGAADPAMPAGGVAPATIEAFRPGVAGSWVRSTSQHRQHHHPDAAIRASLAAAGLECLAVHGLTPDGALHADVEELAHTKRLYVTARHPSQPGRR